jgi:hypothetical protein
MSAAIKAGGDFWRYVILENPGCADERLVARAPRYETALQIVALATKRKTYAGRLDVVRQNIDGSMTTDF